MKTKPLWMRALRFAVDLLPVRVHWFVKLASVAVLEELKMPQSTRINWRRVESQARVCWHLSRHGSLLVSKPLTHWFEGRTNGRQDTSPNER